MEGSILSSIPSIPTDAKAVNLNCTENTDAGTRSNQVDVQGWQQHVMCPVRLPGGNLATSSSVPPFCSLFVLQPLSRRFLGDDPDTTGSEVHLPAITARSRRACVEHCPTWLGQVECLATSIAQLQAKCGPPFVLPANLQAVPENHFRFLCRNATGPRAEFTFAI